MFFVAICTIVLSGFHAYVNNLSNNLPNLNNISFLWLYQLSWSLSPLNFNHVQQFPCPDSCYYLELLYFSNINFQHLIFHVSQSLPPTIILSSHRNLKSLHFSFSPVHNYKLHSPWASPSTSCWQNPRTLLCFWLSLASLLGI